MAIAPAGRCRQLVAYALCGLLTTVVNVVSFKFCRSLFVFPLAVSNFTAWCLSVVFAFFMNRRFVFTRGVDACAARPSSNGVSLLREFSLFVLSRVFSLALDMGFVWLTIAILAFDELAMKILSNCVVIVVNYLTSLLIVFRSGESHGKK
jgi:putative flippase GtrA